MIITIDGPAGAGKSTVAKAVARRLGFRPLDTGATYRAFTWKALREKIDLADARALVKMMGAASLELDGEKVILDGRDISREIRSREVTNNAHYLANSEKVRAVLVRLQRKLGRCGNLVTEGRDQGTVVFPKAEVKIYLDASLEERARRRHRELEVHLTAREAKKITLKQLRKEIAGRDQKDKTRKVGALRPAAGAIYLDTSKLTVGEVVEKIVRRVKRLSACVHAQAGKT